MAKKYSIQLMDRVTGKHITAAGGVVAVVENGGFDKVSLQDAAGAAASNPSALTNGLIEFYTATSVISVDLYGIAPGGHFFVATGVIAGSLPEIFVDANQMHQVARIPFSHADSAAAVEQDTGFDLPAGCMVLGMGLGLHVGNIDSTETIDFGILSSETNGDANGFGATLSIAAAGRVKATLASGGQTLGALVNVDESGAGVLVPEGWVGDGVATSVSYTTSAGTDTGDGLLVIPYILPSV